MSRPERPLIQAGQGVAQAVVQGGDVRQAVGQAVGQAGPAGSDSQAQGFALNPHDFAAARDGGVSIGTQIEARTASLNEAGEIINRSFAENGMHVISPVVIPKGTTAKVVLPLGVLVVLGLIGALGNVIPDTDRVLRPPLLGRAGAGRRLPVVAAQRGHGARGLQGADHQVRQAGADRGPGPGDAVQPVEAGQLHRQHHPRIPVQRPHQRGPDPAGRQGERRPVPAVPDREPGRVHLRARLGQRLPVQAAERHQRGHPLPHLRPAGRGHLRPGGREHGGHAGQPQPAVPARRTAHRREHHARRAVQPGVPDGPGRPRDGAGGQGGLHLRVRAAAAQGAERGRPGQGARRAAGDAERDPGGDRRLPGAHGHRAGAGQPTRPRRRPGSAWSRPSPRPRPTRPCWRRRRWTSGRSAPPRRRRSSTTASSRTCWTSWSRSSARLPQVVQVGEQTDIDFLALAQQLVGGKGAALFSRRGHGRHPGPAGRDRRARRGPPGGDRPRCSSRSRKRSSEAPDADIVAVSATVPSIEGEVR